MPSLLAEGVTTPSVHLLREASLIDERAVELGVLMQSAALDPTKWEPALNAINAFVGGSGVTLLSVTARERFAPVSTDATEMVEDYFARGWYAADRREACLPLLKAKGIVFDHEYQSVEEIVNCDYYHDFLARHDQKWFAGIGVEVDGDTWCLALQRSPKLGAYGAGDMARLTFVRGLLSNTAQLSRQIGRSWMAGLQQALDVMGQPAVVLDCRARVVQRNNAAIAVLGAAIDDRMLRFDAPQDQAAFDTMLKTALSPLRLTPDAEADVRIDGRRYSCRATSLLAQEGLIATRAAALVVLKPSVAHPVTLLRGRFGLTDAEVRVAGALADGKGVAEIAADNRVAIGTIRAQLKSIFQKSNVNSQSKLVALVHGLAAD